MFGASEFVFEGFEVVEGFFEFLAVVEGELFEKEFFIGSLVFEQGDILGFDLLDDFVVAHQSIDLGLLGIVLTHHPNYPYILY